MVFMCSLSLALLACNRLFISIRILLLANETLYFGPILDGIEYCLNAVQHNAPFFECSTCACADRNVNTRTHICMRGQSHGLKTTWAA